MKMLNNNKPFPLKHACFMNSVGLQVKFLLGLENVKIIQKIYMTKRKKKIITSPKIKCKSITKTFIWPPLLI